MLPERSAAGKSAKSVLYEEYNDVDIFIEDTSVGYTKMYSEIFSRLFKDDYRVSNVFPLGGRDHVINECLKFQDSFPRPSLYVIDGDLHLMLGTHDPELKGLYVLPFYCIENILIDENAISDLLNEEEHTKLRAQVCREFDYDGWLSNNRENLLKLFIVYAVCFCKSPEIQTVGYSVTSLVSSNTGVVDKIKIESRIDELKNEVISKIGEKEYLLIYNEISKLVTINNENFIKYVSGKNIFMPLLTTRFKSIVNTKISNINFKMRLALKCDLTDLSDCQSYIAG